MRGCWMPRGQTLILASQSVRERAKRMIDLAPDRSVVNIQEENRTSDQNAKMWAMLSDISRAKPEGRRHTAETWKGVFMQACGWEVQFVEGLDGRPFPEGFRSSRMTVKQMADLITFIQSYGDQHGVLWTYPEDRYEET